MARKPKTTTKRKCSPISGTPPPPGWQPGQSGNPKGRPVSRPMTEAIKKYLEGKTPIQIDGKDYAISTLDALIHVAADQALKGDFRFWKEIIERSDGKVPDALDVTTDGNTGFDWLGDLAPETKAQMIKELGGPDLDEKPKP